MEEVLAVAAKMMQDYEVQQTENQKEAGTCGKQFAAVSLCLHPGLLQWKEGVAAPRVLCGYPMYGHYIVLIIAPVTVLTHFQSNPLAVPALY